MSALHWLLQRPPNKDAPRTLAYRLKHGCATHSHFAGRAIPVNKVSKDDPGFEAEVDRVHGLVVAELQVKREGRLLLCGDPRGGGLVKGKATTSVRHPALKDVRGCRSAPVVRASW